MRGDTPRELRGGRGLISRLGAGLCRASRDRLARSPGVRSEARSPNVVLDEIGTPVEPIPTLILGLGGSGAEVVRRYRARTEGRGDAAAAPLVASLVLDTDA